MSFSKLLYDSGVIRFGEFTLKSGEKSDYFLNFGRICCGPELAMLGKHLGDTIMEHCPDVEVVLGPPYKAISMASAVVMSLWLNHQKRTRLLTFRKESKGHGEGGDFLGSQLNGGDRIVLVDDVMTSGGTKVEALEKVRAYAKSLGVEPPRFLGVVVGVDRQQNNAAAEFEKATGVPVYPVTRASQLFEDLREFR